MLLKFQLKGKRLLKLNAAEGFQITQNQHHMTNLQQLHDFQQQQQSRNFENSFLYLQNNTLDHAQSTSQRQ